nr:probable protein phosphatase 2C 45 [Hydra vulgaris]
MSTHFVSLKGDRPSNEDCHNIILELNSDNRDVAKVNYYGIYDGHGGKFVSKFLMENLPQFFMSSKVQYPLNRDYVNNVYDKIKNVLFTKYEKESMECGSTCLVVCHFKDSNTNHEFLNIMNTGDSRAVLCRNSIAYPLTRDHKPDWPDETNRITKLGGQIRKDGGVYRINDLSVSRAFGDKESSKYVTHRPDMYKYTLTKRDKFMIIACDGLWDVISSQDAVNMVLRMCYDSDKKRINQKINISSKLAEKAIELDSGDNVTCIVIQPCSFNSESRSNIKIPHPNENEKIIDVFGNSCYAYKDSEYKKRYINDHVFDNKLECLTERPKTQFTNDDIDAYREKQLEFRDKINGTSSPAIDPVDKMNLIAIQGGIKAQGQSIKDYYDKLLVPKISSLSQKQHKHPFNL